jgi:hypothetical protein
VKSSVHKTLVQVGLHFGKVGLYNVGHGSLFSQQQSLSAIGQSEHSENESSLALSLELKLLELELDVHLL